MALPNLRDYYEAAQLGPIVKWCDKHYNSKWKEIEMRVANKPVQSLLGNITLIKTLKDSIDPITFHTRTIWADFIKRHRLEKEVRLLSWIAYDERFKPNLSDLTYRNWERKGITAMCTILKNGNIMSFQDLREIYGLKN